MAMEVSFKALPFDLAFHPSRELVAVGLVNGRVHLYSYAGEQPRRRWSVRPHKVACRGIRFIREGQVLLSVSSDCSIQATDVETGQSLSRLTDAHESAIYRIVNLTESTVATGDDLGVVKVWDIRQNTCCFDIPSHTDYVSDMEFVPETMQLVSVSGDGTLVVNNMRHNRLDATSEFSEAELLSVVTAKHGRKVVCGTQEGWLLLYTWGEFAQWNDKFVGHPNSVDAMLKWDEDTLVTGSGDGMIRIVSVLPNKMVGVVGEHAEFPVERLALSHDRSLLGSISHDNMLKLWEIGQLMSEGGAAGQEPVTMEVGAAAAAASEDEDEMDEARKQRKRKGKAVVNDNPFFADL